MIATHRRHIADSRPSRRLHGLLFALAMLSIGLSNAEAHAADLTPAGYRVAKSVNKFDDVWQYGAIYHLRPPRRLRARHLEFAIGALASPSDTRPFVSLGPTWNVIPFSQNWSLDLGFSVTLLGGSTFDGRDLGGNVHFTSSIELGRRFGAQRNYAVALRFQHTSNGGLDGTNPGLDAVALNFTLDLPQR